MNKTDKAAWEKVKNLSGTEKSAWVEDYIERDSIRQRRRIRRMDLITYALLIVAALIMIADFVRTVARSDGEAVVTVHASPDRYGTYAYEADGTTRMLKPSETKDGKTIYRTEGATITVDRSGRSVYKTEGTTITIEDR